MSDGQLWSKQLPLDELVHRFTVGNDHVLDMKLLHWDLLGTAAHIRMLAHCGLIGREEREQLLAGLVVIRDQHRRGEFCIDASQEDCHTAIEQALAGLAPAAAGNVHLGRSRNDQVLTALRLYMKHSLLQLAHATAGLAGQYTAMAQEQAATPMPGYTHLRRAMPSSVGQWLAASAWGLVDTLQAVPGLLYRLDTSPLGSGAGFGIPLRIDREYSARLLGFAGVQMNPVDCANSRGRHELALCSWIAEIGNVLEKFVRDALLYSTEEFGYISLPDEFTTGSSIMPQKRNPDVLELVRGRIAQLRAWRSELEHVYCGLPSNYHRDYQLLKPALFSSVNGLSELLAVLCHVLPGIRFSEDRLQQACSMELHAAAEAYRRAGTGEASFRDAYRQVGAEVLAGSFSPAGEVVADTAGLLPKGELSALAAAVELAAAQAGDGLESLAGQLDRLLPT